MATDLAKYIVSLEAETAKYRQGLDAANRKLDRFHKDQERALGKIKSAFLSLGATLAAAFSVRAIVNFTKSAIQAADAIGETAKAAGFGAERFQRLQFVFGQNGVEANEFSAAMRTLNTRLGQFITTGAGPAAKALGQLGLKQRVLSGELDTAEELFDAITASLGNVDGSAERAAIAAAFFGREAGAKMQDQLRIGIDAMNEAAEAANGIFNDDTVAKADALANSFGRLGRMWNSIKGTSIAATFSLASLFGVDETENIEIQLAELKRQRDAILLTPARPAAREASLAPVDKQIELLEKQIEYERLLKVPFVQPRAVAELADFDAIVKEAQQATDILQARLDAAEVARQHQFQLVQDVLAEQDRSQEFVDGLFAIDTEAFAEEAQLATDILQARLEAMEIKASETAAFIGGSFRSAFDDWIMGTERNFSDMLKRMAVQMATSALFKGLATLFPAGSFFSTFFAGARAEGGPVSAGKGYLVGERGPEMFFPGRSGMIAASGAGGGVVINQYNTFNTSGGERDQTALRAELAKNNQQLKAEIRHEIGRRRM